MYESARSPQIVVAAVLLALAACGGDSAGPNVAPTAAAGSDQDVNRSAMVTLNGGGTDPEGAALTVSWTQTSGPSVGALNGVNPSFTAPNAIVTLEFEVLVSDGDLDATDRVAVRVLEDKDHALWVAPSGNNANAGTRASPKGTIQGAIDASTAGADVYVAAGMYAGTLTLKNGVSVYGGYNATTWMRDVATNTTTVAGGSTALQGGAVTGLTLDGLRIQAANAVGGGASSIGVLLDGSSGIVISHNTIVAGNGANGADGVSAVAGGAGAAGDSGRTACGDPPPSEINGCGADGGAGGNGAAAGGSGAGGHYATPGYAGAAGSGSDGGTAGSGGINPAAAGPGGPGGSGASGLNGFSGGNLGSFSGSLYLPSGGLAGGAGTDGSGGGGGGGGWGYETIILSDIYLTYGAGGGGGGGGGFGGAGGAAGGGGGAAFGVVLLGSSATLTDNVITTGNGGAGGDGAAGSDGGAGGAGGAAGSASIFGSGPGGPGGAGGDGGEGGGGGGGGGGPSIGIVEDAASSTNVTDVNLAGNTFTLGSAGVGGSHGTVGVGGGANGRQVNRLKL
jgi:K319-like protein